VIAAYALSAVEATSLAVWSVKRSGAVLSPV
jgi:hypothetical protein